MNHSADRKRGDSDQLMEDVQRDAHRQLRCSEPASEQTIERSVQNEEESEPRDGRSRPARQGGRHQDNGRDCRHAVCSTQVQGGGERASLQRQRDPRDTSIEEVGSHHRPKRPSLEVSSADRRIYLDAATARGESRAQLDVLDRGPRVTLGVESAGVEKCLASHSSQAGPERLDGTCRLDVDVVMKEIAEARDDPGRLGSIVVRAEERVELGVVCESPPDSSEGIGVDQHVGIDEDENLAGPSRGASVTRHRRT
jgi:hypothetical protein